MDNAIRLLPCPFCGSEAQAIAKLNAVACSNLHCKVAIRWVAHESIEHAIAAWNTRALVPAEPTPEMIAAGISALDDCVDHDWDSGPDGESHNSYTTIRSDAAAIIYRAMAKEALDRIKDQSHGG